MEKTRQDNGLGRKRPPYKPKDIHCANCGAGLTQKDEHSEMIVCQYCGSHLKLSQTEMSVLNKGHAKKHEFPLNLGDTFRYKGSKYEIIARLAFIEDNDYEDLTHQYLMYNPRLGPLYLDEYLGQYSISQTTHVMPQKEPFGLRRGDILKTHDNKQWVTEGLGTYELIYVDGALPWVAKIGDKIKYAEFSEKSGSGIQYEVQRIGNEIEYGTGKSISTEMVRRATGKNTLAGQKAGQPAIDSAKALKFQKAFILVALLAVIFNGAMTLYALSRGKQVLYQHFNAEELNSQSFSKSFVVSKDNCVLKIKTIASPSLNNAWMTLDLAILEADDKVIHVADSDLEYYHGYEGGESWSEGSQKSTTYVQIPKAGTYRIMAHAISASGNQATSNRTSHGINIYILEGALKPGYCIAALIISGIVLIFSLISLSKFKNQDDD